MKTLISECPTYFVYYIAAGLIILFEKIYYLTTHSFHLNAVGYRLKISYLFYFTCLQRIFY